MAEGMSLEEKVKALTQMQPEQREQILSRMPAEEREELQAYAQQKGGNSKPKPQKPAYRAPSYAEVKKKIFDSIESVDQFTGSFLSNTTRAYAVTSAIPIFLANPIAGAFYAALVGATSYYGTNFAYNAGIGTLGFMYNAIKHPADTLKSIFYSDEKKASSGMVFDAVGKVGGLLSSPFRALKELIKPRKESRWGKILGNVLGSGIALNQFAPRIYDRVSDLAGAVLAPAVDSGKEGLTVFADKAKGLVDAVQNAASNYYWNTLYINNPLDYAETFVEQTHDNLVYKH